MSPIWLAVLLALFIPIIALLVDSPIGRAVAKRVANAPEPAAAPDAALAELQRRLELLEGDVEAMQQTVNQLRDDNQFLQRLLEEGASRPPSPPGTT